MSKWYAVKDKLPNDTEFNEEHLNTELWIWDNDAFVSGFYEMDKPSIFGNKSERPYVWVDASGNYLDNVTYWSPIEGPYDTDPKQEAAEDMYEALESIANGAHHDINPYYIANQALRKARGEDE